ncbi:hypothetical protein [Amedibacillus sp. YH-ame10]
MEHEQLEEVSLNWRKEVQEIYASFDASKQVLSDAKKEQLRTLLENREAEVSIDEYVNIMYMEGKTYESEGNRNAARYCAMRILWMKECYEKPKKKRPRFLDMHPYTFRDEVVAFVREYTDFLTETYANINRKLLIISGLLLVVVIAILFFVLQVNILLAIVEGIGLCALNFWLQKRKLPEMFQKNQTNVIEKYIDADLLEFDRSYRVF